jgi:cytochrome c-type biogenesis protein CcmH
VLRRFARALALAIALTGSIAASVSAADDAKAWHYEVWNTTMSPFCPGRALIDCPSSQAAELRDWIVTQEKAGRPRKEVEDELYERFGDVILQAPKATGFGLAAYVIPVVGVALGALVLVIFLRRQAASAQRTPAPVAVAPDPELDRLIDEEMSRR